MIKYYVTKHLILQKIQNMTDNKVDLFQWSIIFVDKKLSGSGIKLRIFQTKN